MIKSECDLGSVVYFAGDGFMFCLVVLASSRCFLLPVPSADDHIYFIGSLLFHLN